jgi:hypothetical protein
MTMPTVFNRPPHPAELGEIDVMADGSIALKHEWAGVEFAFRSCGLPFSAVTRVTESGPVLQIAAEVASDPYSVEGAGMREAVHALIRSSHAAPHCRLMVSRRKRIYCVGRTQIGNNWTPSTLLTAAAELILEARPYLMVLRDILPRWAKPAA